MENDPLTFDQDIESFQAAAAKLGARVEAGDPTLDELFRMHGLALRRVLLNALAHRRGEPPSAG